MKINNSEGRGFNGLIKPLVAATAIGAVGVALAITDAGTVIKNLATVTYVDSNNDPYTATSNEAQVTVANVYNATLENDNVGGEAAPGQTVYFPHVLTNTGNGSDTYTLTVADDALIASTATGLSLPADTTIYIDENGNGQPDAGEPTITNGNTITLDASEVANLIVAVDVPVTATAGQLVNVSLTAQGNAAGTVEDLTPETNLNTDTDSTGGLDDDALDASATNHDRLTVTLSEVIVATKSSILDLDPDNVPTSNDAQITYTLTVKNTGGADADLVDIFEAIPANTIFDASSVTVSGLLTANNDTRHDGTVFVTPADLTPANITLTTTFGEPAGVDMDGDGVLGEASVSGFVVRDVVLPPNTTVSVSYTVDISTAPAGSVFKNRFCAGEDIVGGASATTFDLGAEVADCSNQTVDELPEIYSIVADDDDAAGALFNDDDVTYRAEAPIGGTADFTHQVHNKGTAADIVNLEAGANTFPSGTVFTFWEAGGVVPLTDNDGDGNPDVGLVQPGATVSYVLRAILPSTITPATLSLTAVSSLNNTLVLADGTNDAIVVDGAGDYFVNKDGDVATAAGGQDLGGADTYVGNDDTVISGTNPDGVQIVLTDANDQFEDDEVFQVVVNATSKEDASKTDSTISALGKIVSAKVDLANGITAFASASNTYAVGFNDDGTVDAHTADPVIIYGNGDEDDANFDAGGTDTDAPVTGNAGTENDAAVLAGQTITVPLSLANEGAGIDAYDLSSSAPTGVEVVFKDSAGNVITSTPAQNADEVFNYVAEVTFTPEAAAGNLDVTFSVKSPTTSTTLPAVPDDSLVDRFVLALSCDVEVSAAALQQVQAGGNVDYIHTVNNSSNGAVTFTFTPMASPPTGWTGVMVATAVIDLTNNGVTGDDLAAGDVIPSGQTIVLPAGGSVTFIHRIFAPANASDAQTEVLTIAVASTACGTTTIEDVASVIVGQVRLEKLVSIDDTCDCVADNAFAVAGSAAIEPGDCAVWQLTATNEGNQNANSVVINDSLTEYTAFVSAATTPGVLPGSDDAVGTANAFTACKGVGCAPVAGTIAGGNLGGVTLAVTGEVLSYTVGTLNPGDSAVGTFCVQVQ